MIHSDSELGLSFDDLVVHGGDERLDIGKAGSNKYHVLPTRHKGVFNRGSCTSSPFSLEGYAAAHELFCKLSDEQFDRSRAEQTRKIKEIINYDKRDQFHVFYAPSGSDLCYYQLLFSKLINPDRDIYNIVTCPEELGSGSIAALQGKYYAGRNQFGDLTEPGQALGASLNVTSELLAARDREGKIFNHSSEIVKSVHNVYKSHSVCANLVVGSKSGIENNISVVSQVPENVLWTIDLCQFRASRVFINGLLGMNCSVMLTGSKFYQGPPFSAVLLVPKTVTNRFNYSDPKVVDTFAGVFSYYDIPEELPEIRERLPEYRNYGLLLRWEAALREMELLSALDSYDLNETTKLWNDRVCERLALSSHFQLMPNQDVTNKSIISFRVKSSDGDFLSHEQLVSLYHDFCGEGKTVIGDFEQVLIGQPVKYGERSFIRLALGASSLREFVSQGFDFSNDEKLIDMLEELVKVQF